LDLGLMLGGPGARNKTQKRRKRKAFAKSSCPRDYLKAGMFAANSADDSSEVNVRGWKPTLWAELGMLFLNLVVWLEAAARMAGWTHAV
jgi:hypothetical protein